MYAKIFTQIYDSSIADDWQVRVVFEDMVILADSDGVLDMTIEALSARTRIPLDIVTRAVKHLERPDPKSRTPDHEGRRLILLSEHRNWGWRIVNYRHYREMRNKFDRKEYMRKYMRDNRPSRAKGKQEVKPSLTLSNQVKLSPSPSPSSVQEGGTGETAYDLPPGFPPTSSDAITHAAFVGCDPIFATAVWNKAVGRGGSDSRDVPIRSFRHHLATEWSYEQARRQKEKINGAHRQAFPRDIKLQMDAIKQQIETHPANRESVVYNGKPTDLERASLKTLRTKWNDLNNQLANGS